jgi:Protein of unknown function (DUF3168)
MSISNALQKLVYDLLVADAGVGALVGGRIYDRPSATVAAPYVSFGPSDYVPDDEECINGRIEALQIDAWSEAQDGKREGKAICDAIKAALHDAVGSLSVGALVTMRVVLVRVFDDADGRTTHGVVQIEAVIEEGEP